MPAVAVPLAGKILVLDNDQLIEGDIYREGDRYCIRRGNGETTVPAKRVVEVVADRRQAYRVIRDRSNTHDWDDRMRLVRWCMENQLRDEALLEASALLKFRPQDAQLRTLVQGLQTLQIEPVEAVPEPTAPAKVPDKVLEIEMPDYNHESFSLFVTKVQPILMNTCASCHAAGKGGHFVLVRNSDGGNRKAALFNLASTLKQIDRTQPISSPLLARAVAAHGKATRPPIRDQQALAYQYLEAWATSAVGSEGTRPMPVSVLKIREEEPIKPQPKQVEAPKPPVPPVGKFGETSSTRVKPEPQTEAKDPFDPAIFNGTIQPKK